MAVHRMRDRIGLTPEKNGFRYVEYSSRYLPHDG